MFQNNAWTDDPLGGTLLPPHDTPQDNPYSATDLGPISVGNTTQGLTAKQWYINYNTSTGECTLEGYGVLFVRTGISRVCLTFDFNGRPFVAFEQEGVVWIWWYDPLTSSQVFSQISEGVLPFARLDERRPEFSTISDIILIYFRNGSMFFRVQRDRFLVEYPTQFTNISPSRVLNFGMSNLNRLQVDYEVDKPNIIHTFVEVCVKSLEETQKGMFDMLNYRGISSAYAAQLDLIGKILVLDRKGFGDDVYRRSLYLKAATNNNEGSPNEILTATKLVTNGTKANIWEHFPACIFLYTDGAEEDVIISRNRIGQLIPVGVDGLYLLYSENADVFTPVEHDNSLLLDASQYLPEHTELSPSFGELVELHITTEE